ncbi:unnamed protein product [Polarella glacialis]|uniref:Uncharacterized protein n=1 Tax=Polarella glacialis TaxID=89957 RepID=A0A813JL00_POLGL|nr:unnamed protein product [Polarella glacialis]CAE8679722.1 unnamed protein product [Polarella glacialis]
MSRLRCLVKVFSTAWLLKETSLIPVSMPATHAVGKCRRYTLRLRVSCLSASIVSLPSPVTFNTGLIKHGSVLYCLKFDTIRCRRKVVWVSKIMKLPTSNPPKQQDLLVVLAKVHGYTAVCCDSRWCCLGLLSCLMGALGSGPGVFPQGATSPLCFALLLHAGRISACVPLSPRCFALLISCMRLCSGLPAGRIHSQWFAIGLACFLSRVQCHSSVIGQSLPDVCHNQVSMQRPGHLHQQDLAFQSIGSPGKARAEQVGPPGGFAKAAQLRYETQTFRHGRW